MASIRPWFTFAFSDGKRKKPFCAVELSATARSVADLGRDFSV